jgi:ABC-type lipoprotein release transport system permease subunit
VSQGNVGTSDAQRLRILLLLSLRNLAAHRVKSGIIGSILAFATFLTVLGSALVDSMSAATARSVTTSLSGDLQVYSADAVDRLAVFGGIGPASSDIGEIPDIARVEAVLGALPEVRAVVPMGISSVTVFTDNELDRVLGDLRTAIEAGDDASAARGRARVAHIATSVAADLEARAAVQADSVRIAEGRAVVARVGSPAFWAEFPTNLQAVDYLEANLAPLTGDGRVFYLRAIGTDLHQFATTFDSFYVVDGQAAPEGRRGMFLSKRTYERLIKNKVARELDTLFEAWQGGARMTDTAFSERAARLPAQHRRVLQQLDPVDAEALTPRLRAFLGSSGDLPALVQELLRVDDTNLEARRTFFYAEIAPMIRLYEIPVGSTVTLRAITRSGYARSVTVPVWGTYELRGLEKSDLASASNLLDLVTWRELYGKMSTEQQEELSAIRMEVGVRDVDAASIEDALFGGAAPETVTTPTAAAGFDEFAGVDMRRVKAEDASVDPAQMHRGLALNAAVFLRDPRRPIEGAARIREAAEAAQLGIQVVGWQEAAGLLGQFITVIEGVLYAAIFVIFIVGLIIVNNALVAATLDRTTEIGTMRAIGAPRGFVVGMFLLETVALGMVSGAVGAAVATAFVGWLGRVGLPAPAEAFVMLFAGPRLYPTVSVENLAFGIAAVLVTSIVSAVYPAVLAARVRPVVAMQEQE